MIHHAMQVRLLGMGSASTRLRQIAAGAIWLLAGDARNATRLAVHNMAVPRLIDALHASPRAAAAAAYAAAVARAQRDLPTRPQAMPPPDCERAAVTAASAAGAAVVDLRTVAAGALLCLLSGGHGSGQGGAAVVHAMTQGADVRDVVGPQIVATRRGVLRLLAVLFGDDGDGEDEDDDDTEALPWRLPWRLPLPPTPSSSYLTVSCFV